MRATETTLPEPFSIGDLPLGRAVDEALALTQRHGWQAALVGIIPPLPIAIGVALVQSWLLQTERIDPLASNLLIDGVWWALFVGLVGVPLEAGMIYLLAMAYLGKPIPTREAFRHAARCWLRTGPAYVVVLAVVFAGMMLCFLPGLAVITLLFFHLTVMALEGTGPIAAVRRGLALMRGREGRLFLIVCALVVVAMGASSIAEMTGNPYLAVALFQLFTAPIELYTVALTVVLYFSARSRLESIDLQLLADAIAATDAEQDTFRL